MDCVREQGSGADAATRDAPLNSCLVICESGHLVLGNCITYYIKWFLINILIYLKDEGGLNLTRT